MKILVLLIVLTSTLAAADTIRMNKRIITDGDSEGAVMKIAGKPDRRIQLVNKYGAGVGEKWVYYLDTYGAEKTVEITLSGGRVQSITEIRD